MTLKQQEIIWISNLMCSSCRYLRSPGSASSPNSCPPDRMYVIRHEHYLWDAVERSCSKNVELLVSGELSSVQKLWGDKEKNEEDVTMKIINWRGLENHTAAKQIDCTVSNKFCFAIMTHNKSMCWLDMTFLLSVLDPTLSAFASRRILISRNHSSLNSTLQSICNACSWYWGVFQPFVPAVKYAKS